MSVPLIRRDARTSRRSETLAALVASFAFVISVTFAEPIVTPEKVFYVPFTAPTDSGANGPKTVKAVELFVSGDQGANWQSYQQRAPGDGRFSFQAGGDGIYYFATRTIDQNGQPSRNEVTDPELIVIVDRTQPHLQAQTQVEADGSVSATWEVVDPNLEPHRFSIQYRNAEADADSSWQTADARGNSKLLPGGRLQGNLIIWPPAGCRKLQIRITANDRASNVAVVDRELDLTKSTVNASPQNSTFPVLANANNAGAPPVPTVGPLPPMAQSPSANTAALRQPPSVPSQAQIWKPNTVAHAPAPHSPAQNAWTQPGIPMQTKPPVANAYPRTAMVQTPQMAQDALGAQVAARSPEDSFADAESFRLSKSQRFHLDYDIDAQDGEGVFRVEIWSTTDGGRTWQHMGDDEDRVSPYLVATSGDGMYGFRLIVQSKEGLAARPPQNGEPADVWVRVDSTPPVTQLTSARYGRGSELGMLKITWDVRDADLSDQPVTLLYSGNVDGPWRKIAGDLANLGQYDWQVDDRIPSRFYLRLEAVDRAGNIGIDSLRDPIRSSGLAPRGTIRGVRPVVSSAASPTQRTPAK